MEIDDKKEEKENEKNILRVIIVGDEDTGKTEYLDRVRNVDNRKLSSKEVEMRFRKIEIDDKTYFIEIIKIPGKDKHLHYPNIKSLAAQVFGSFCFCSAQSPCADNKHHKKVNSTRRYDERLAIAQRES